ncbi:MAG: DEAD/DEAH box helicase [Ilumatobacteraceae bacterium]
MTMIDDAPRVISIPFADLGLPPRILQRLQSQGMSDSFPIQAAVIPDALAGRDVAGRAPTGSGKTLGFGLPLVARLTDARPRRPVALVLAPTRELAEQIMGELAPFAKAEGHAAVAIYGGVGYGPQKRALDQGVEVVVACPGRLEDLLQMRALDLRDIATVVIDEADQMADMGFLPAVRRIVEQTRSDRQVLLFSATLDGPVAKLVADFQRNPARHEVGPKGPDVHAAQHLFWTVDREARVATTAEVINRLGSTIVFTRTRHGADRLAKQLGKVGVDAEPIHGGRSQGQRDRALASFKKGSASALIATDVAARGIHVNGVSAVIHFDPPAEDSTYLHRSGRTARAGATGTVVSLLEGSQKKDAKKLQRGIGIDEPITEPRFGSLLAPAPAPTPARAPRAEESRAEGSSRQVVIAAPKKADGASKKATPASAPLSVGGAGDGAVKFFNSGRGYGFITPDGGGKDLFVHFSVIVNDGFKTLDNGARVAYQVREGRNGAEAFDVRVVG